MNFPQELICSSERNQDSFNGNNGLCLNQTSAKVPGILGCLVSWVFVCFHPFFFFLNQRHTCKKTGKDLSSLPLEGKKDQNTGS